MSHFDRHYDESEHYFGTHPEPLLLRFLDRLDPSLPVIDVGCGQGRNSFVLARQGIRVLAVEPSVTAINAVNDAAHAEALPIVTRAVSFESVTPTSLTDWTGEDCAGAALLFGLIPILHWDAIHSLATWCVRIGAPSGMVFATAFSTLDPGRKRHQEQWRRIGIDSFQHPHSGEIRTYLNPGQILELLSEFETLHHWEGMGPLHQHGSGPMHQHAMIEFVGRRQA